MNSKNIKKHLNAKLNDWLSHIDDEEIKKILRNNVIITGGALVSLLTGEKVHDYDVYLRTNEACKAVAEYYVRKWNEAHGDEGQVSLKIVPSKTIQVPSYENGERKVDENGNPMTHPVVTPERIKVFVQSVGVVERESLLILRLMLHFRQLKKQSRLMKTRLFRRQTRKRTNPSIVLSL